MKITLIRNATLRLEYAGHTLVIDPYFAAAKSLPSYAGRSKNPLVDLPIAPLAILDGTEAVLISHTHTDHFDALAQEMLPKNMPLFCQPADEALIRRKGFTDVTVVGEAVQWQNIRIQRTEGRHGSSNAVLSDMGVVSGFVLRAENEPTLYLAGDTVWYDAIAKIVSETQPDVIVSHSGGAMWGDDELIVMDAEQTIALCKYAPQSKIVAVHLEALDHCTVTRQALSVAADKAKVSAQQLFIPTDGESIDF